MMDANFMQAGNQHPLAIASGAILSASRASLEYHEIAWIDYLLLSLRLSYPWQAQLLDSGAARSFRTELNIMPCGRAVSIAWKVATTLCFGFRAMEIRASLTQGEANQQSAKSKRFLEEAMHPSSAWRSNPLIRTETLA